MFAPRKEFTHRHCAGNEGARVDGVADTAEVLARLLVAVLEVDPLRHSSGQSQVGVTRLTPVHSVVAAVVSENSRPTPSMK